MAKHKKTAPRAQRGETLAEVLVALLIVALATMLLASMVTVSAGINMTARRKDDAFYKALSTVETMGTATAEATMEIARTDTGVTATPETVPVEVYSSDNLARYKVS